MDGQGATPTPSFSEGLQVHFPPLTKLRPSGDCHRRKASVKERTLPWRGKQTNIQGQGRTSAASLGWHQIDSQPCWLTPGKLISVSAMQLAVLPNAMESVCVVLPPVFSMPHLPVPAFRGRLFGPGSLLGQHAGAALGGVYPGPCRNVGATQRSQWLEWQLTS